MFKTLFAVAIAGSANAITDTACTTVSEDKNIYHLSALTRDVGDEYKLNDQRHTRADQVGSKKKNIDLTWNYCQTVTTPDNTDGVYAYEGSSGSTD